MKELKRKMCLILTLIMILGTWTAPAFAAGTGTFTVYNAEKGRTYTLYKVFDIQETASSMSYSTTNASLGEAIVAGKDDSSCPFNVSGDHSHGIYYIKTKDTYAEDAHRDWLYNNLATWSDSAQKWSKKNETDGNVVTFDGLEFGYYFLTISDDDGATIKAKSSVTNVYSANNPAMMWDKNVKAPSNVEKTTVGLDDKDVTVGEEISYSFKFLARNFYTTEQGQTTLIRNYDIKDEAYGLRLSTPSSMEVKLYHESDEQCLTPYKTLVQGTDYTITKNTFSDGKNTMEMNIPWGATYSEAKYESPVWVKVDYKMVVDESIIATVKKGPTDRDQGENVITVAYDTGKHISGGTPSEMIYSSGLSIAKAKDGTSERLTGAKFVLLNGEGKYYQWATLSENSVDRNYTNWVDDEADATVMLADNSYDTVEFKGLTAGTYYLREVVAPEGYTIPDYDFEVVITFDESRDWNHKYEGTINHGAVIQNQDIGERGHRTYLTAVIPNTSEKKPLPQTGGAGTILLIVGGSILFLAAGIILVTKKRMYNEEV